jgi:hypothetical protein
MKATGRITQNFSKPVGAQCGLTLQRKVGNITCHAEVAKTFSFGHINNNHHQIPALADLLTTGKGYHVIPHITSIQHTAAEIGHAFSASTP